MFEIGKLLIDVKKQLAHGHFSEWLISEVGYTQRTAQNYMTVFRALDGKSETVSRLPMKVVYDIANLPKDQCDVIVSLITDPANPPVAEIKEQVAVQKAHKKSQLLKEKIDHKNAKQRSDATPAAQEAALRHAEKSWEADEAARLAIEERVKTLDDQAVRWINRLGSEMAKEITGAVNTNNPDMVVGAMLRATDALLALTAKAVADQNEITKAVTLDASSYNDVPREFIIQELDLKVA